MYKYIVGLDIGSSKICASVGQINSQSSIQIMGITSVDCSGVKKGIIIDIDETAKVIEKCIFQLEKIVEFKINEAFISIQGGNCEFIDNKGIVAVSAEDSEITNKDVNRVIEATKMISISKNKEIIGIIPEQFSIDGYENIKDPVGMSGIKLELDAKIVLAQSTVINNIIKSINKAGIKVLGIVLGPMALWDVLVEEEERDKCIVIIDVGFETINVSIFKDEKLYKNIFLPLGGKNVTKDISLCLNISYDEAENLKLKYGSVMKENIDNEKIALKDINSKSKLVEYYTLIDIINARVDETLKFIRAFIKETGYYEDVNKIIITGGGICFLKGIVELSENILKKPVKIGYPEYIGASNSLYSTVVGVIKNVSNNISKDEIKVSPKIEEEKEIKNIEIEKDNYETKEDKSGFFVKVKEFFADFF